MRPQDKLKEKFHTIAHRHDIRNLMYAATEKNTKRLNRMIARGVDVNAKDERGITALMYAAGYDCADNVKILIDAGAGLFAKNSLGYTAREIAKRNGRQDIVEILEAAEGQKVREAVHIEDMEELKRLISLGVDLNAKSPTDMTALMKAVILNKPDFVQALVDAGADIDIRCTLPHARISRESSGLPPTNEPTALEYAVGAVKYGCAKILIEKHLENKKDDEFARRFKEACRTIGINDDEPFKREQMADALQIAGLRATKQGRQMLSTLGL